MAKLPRPIKFSEINDEIPAERPEITLPQFADDLGKHMESNGITPPQTWDFTGRTIRFSTNGKSRDTSGWYAVHCETTPFFAVYGDWRTLGDKTIYFAERGKSVDDPEFKSRIEAERENRRKFIDECHEKAMDAAEKMFSESVSNPKADHGYLVAKKIDAPRFVKQFNEKLMVPMFDLSGDKPRISSYQTIDKNGSKRFLLGGKVEGCICPVDGWNVKSTDYIILCEGMATAKSIFDACGYPTFMAFSAGNLPRAYKVLNNLYPMNQVIVVADNDESGTGEKYAKECGCKYVMVPEVGMDANDYVNAGHDLSKLLKDNMPKIRIKRSTDFLDGDYETDWVIENWFIENSFILCFGASGSGKTFFMLDMMMSIAMGLDKWHGNGIRKRLPVMYFAGEGQIGLKKRLHLWNEEHNFKKEDLYDWFSVFEGPTDFDTVRGLSEVIQQIEMSGFMPKIVVLDTLNRYMKGDENSAQESREFINNCIELMTKYGCSVVVVTHTGVSEDAQGRARGSSAWKGAADIELNVARSKTKGMFKVTQQKMKDAEMLDDPYVLKLEKKVIGKDKYGKEITSCVVRSVDSETAAGELEMTLKEDTIDRYKAILNEAIEECAKIENNIKVIYRKDWADLLRRTGRETMISHFFDNGEKRPVGKLIRSGLIERKGKKGNYYFVVRESPTHSSPTDST